MPQRDSLDKIIGTYFACVNAEPFTYKGHEYGVKPLRVSPDIFRGYTCPAICAGCCVRFSLDYLPTERHPHALALEQRHVNVNGKDFLVWSDMQKDHDDHYCRNVSKETGRCAVHGRHPFSCDFELIRFLEAQDTKIRTRNPKSGIPKARYNMLTQKLYGRGWNMLRVDGVRGARCEMTPVTKETTAEVVRKLKRLQKWMDYFEVSSRLDKIIKWAETGPHLYPLYV